MILYLNFYNQFPSFLTNLFSRLIIEFHRSVEIMIIQTNFVNLYEVG